MIYLRKGGEKMSWSKKWTGAQADSSAESDSESVDCKW